MPGHKQEITIEDLPRPGEPLTEKIADENQEMLDQEIRERAARIQALLSRQEYRRLSGRSRKLHSQLNRSHYNDLIAERWAFYEGCVKLSAEIKLSGPKKRERLKLELQRSITQGKKLNRRIARLKPLIREFEAINRRLRAHEAVIAWQKEQDENFAAFKREANVWLEQIKSTMRQSTRLHFKGSDSKGKPFIEIPQIERIIIKDDKVYYHIKTSEQGFLERLFGRWHSALPYDVDIKDLTCDETLENLSAACRRVVTVERSQNGVNLFWVINRLDSPDGIPRRYPYGKAINWYPGELHRKTPWIAGVTEDRKVKWFNFEDSPHVLIAGSTQSGKSNHVNQMIATLVQMNTPAELRLMLVDLKGGIEFVHWTGLKHLMGNIVKTVDGVLVALQGMREIMENRLMIFESIKAKNLSSYNSKAKEPMPRLIVFIDEMATLIGLGEQTTEIHNQIRVLSSQGRAVGIHLVVATQHPSVDVLPGWIKTNMTIRIASKMPSHTASQVILDTITAALLPSVPGRMVFSIGREEVLAQSPYISDDEIATAVADSQRHQMPVDEIEAQPVVVKEKFSEFDFIEMALTVFGGKLSASRVFEEVGNEVCTLRKLRLMQEDIIERAGKQGQIQHRGSIYKLRKERKYYMLDPVKQQHSSEIDEDTGEFQSIDGSIDEEEAAV